MSIQIGLNSEIGPLETVVVHTPGQEIENMTPQTAAEVLYDDILTLPLACPNIVSSRGCSTGRPGGRVADLLAEVLAAGSHPGCAAY
jgi:hypothetical protein